MHGKKLTMKTSKVEISVFSICTNMFKYIRQTNRLKISSMCSLLQGLLIGSLSIGVVLAIVLTVWLTSPHSTSMQGHI